MNGLALVLGLAGVAVAAWWGWRRWVAPEFALRHLEDCVKSWGGVAPSRDRAMPISSPGDPERRPTTIREYCDADRRRIQAWGNGMEAQLDEIRNLPEASWREEWLA